MNANHKRITLIVLAALMAFGFLVGGTRLIAFAQEATMLSEQSSSQRVQEQEVSSQNDFANQAGEFEVYGYVEQITPTSLTIAGRTYAIQATTEFKSQIQVGDYVKLHVYPLGEEFAVREIERAMLGEGDDNSNMNGDDNGNMNGDDDNGNMNGDDDNGNMNGDDDNGNMNGDDDNGNMNGDDDNGNDDDDNGNDDDDNSNDDDDDNSNDDDDDQDDD